MQYILTEKELAQFVPDVAYEKLEKALEVARAAILGDHPCIHDEVEWTGRKRKRGGYCDDCPVITKTGGFKGPYRLVCKLPKEFSK